MRKPIALLGAVALLSIFPAAPAFAEGSIIIQDGLCTGFVPAPDGSIETELTTTESQMVQNGPWVKVTCHFDIPEGSEPDKATHSSGLPCTIPPFGTTTDTRMSASPGGRAVGTCRFKVN